MPKVFVAMSGGVDSSVAAALLKKGRFLPIGRQVFVVGVFMKPWQADGIDCEWKQDREDALRVASKLDIPLLTWDLSKEYEKHVVKYLVNGYKIGITPNPDVMCNRFIKFGVFLGKSLRLGADYVATGHYARKSGDRLLKAKDLNKDQSYFLYALSQEQLKHCLFPIGDYPKDKVRQLAKNFGLPNWDKKDSQGVCFVGQLKMDKFLKKYIKPERGVIVRNRDGKILGEHDGAWYFTIGQRHGLNFGAGRPHYVVGKDVEKNILYVDEDKFGRNIKEFAVENVNWINQNSWASIKCTVKLRYRHKERPCTVKKNGSDLLYSVELDKNDVVAPGQSAVFYKGKEVIGGGIIKLN